MSHSKAILVRQRRIFTCWIEEQFKSKGHPYIIQDFTEECSHGDMLIRLIEVLSGKSAPERKKYSAAAYRYEKMQNLGILLEFMNELGFKHLHHRIHECRGTQNAIVDGNLPTILKLVWSIIRHYQIFLKFDIKEESADNYDFKALKCSGIEKDVLLEYVQRVIPEKNITNFASDWTDGTAIRSFVHAHVAPGSDTDTGTCGSAFGNAYVAMETAEELLKIPKVIDCDDMINCDLDERSRMTYLSQFPKLDQSTGTV